MLRAYIAPLPLPQRGLLLSYLNHIWKRYVENSISSEKLLALKDGRGYRESRKRKEKNITP